MFTLKKIELEDGKESALPVGHMSALPDAILYNYETDEKKSLNSVQDVEIGWQVVLFSDSRFHRTSKIREIVSKDSDKVVFKTQTSVYQLTKDNGSA